jgi:hypothetical protein
MSTAIQSRPVSTFTPATQLAITLALQQLAAMPPRQRNTVVGVGFVFFGLTVLAKA